MRKKRGGVFCTQPGMTTNKSTPKQANLLNSLQTIKGLNITLAFQTYADLPRLVV